MVHLIEHLMPFKGSFVFLLLTFKLVLIHHLQDFGPSLDFFLGLFVSNLCLVILDFIIFQFSQFLSFVHLHAKAHFSQLSGGSLC